jgi:hypothetical protein
MGRIPCPLGLVFGGRRRLLEVDLAVPCLASVPVLETLGRRCASSREGMIFLQGRRKANEIWRS